MAKDFNKDIQDAVSATAGKGFGDVPKTEKTQEPKPQSSAMTTATDSLQDKAAKSAQQLALVETEAQRASINKGFKNGQQEAMTETLAEGAGYLGAKAQLKAISVEQRIRGVEKIRQDAQTQLAAEVEALQIDGDDIDPLARLSGLTGDNHGLLLPSPFA
jgi:flagellar biosynthesis/type III secretory pathway protein FliH